MAMPVPTRKSKIYSMLFHIIESFFLYLSFHSASRTHTDRVATSTKRCNIDKKVAQEVADKTVVGWQGKNGQRLPKGTRRGGEK
jgi:hypothetical protein